MKIGTQVCFYQRVFLCTFRGTSAVRRGWLEMKKDFELKM
jgi:hypothetical protein